MSGKRLRDVLRLVHILGAVVLGMLTYAPPDEYGWLRPLAQYVVVPAVTASGVWMWQQARVRRLLRERPARARAGE